MKIVIIEGIFEGKLHSGRLRRELERRGYIVTNNPTDADVVITHSGGWVFLPGNHDGQRVVFIDPSYKTERSFTARAFSRLGDILHPRWHMALERIWNVWYIIPYFAKWVRLVKLAHTKQIDSYLMQPGAFVIGVGDHSWWHQPTIDSTSVTYTRLTGDHDIIWSQPQLFLVAAGLFGTQV